MSPLVHIGYHKTASTWLQRQVFRPEMGFQPMLPQAKIDTQIVAPHDLDFDPRRALSGALEPAQGQVSVLSSENLTGHPFFGGRDSANLAWRLKELVPDATILIVIRSQRTILPSVYMQYLKRGGVLPPERFFETSSGVNYPGFDPLHFAYDRLIALYQSLFADVCVLTQEALAKDPQSFTDQIYAASGLPARPLTTHQLKRISPSPKHGAIALLRATNRMRRSTLNPAPIWCLGREGGQYDRVVSAVAKMAPQAQTLSRYVDDELAPHYGQSNASLCHLTSGALDLSAYPQSQSERVVPLLPAVPVHG